MAFNGRAAVAYRMGRNEDVLDNAGQALAVAQAHNLAAEQAQALKLMHTAAEVAGDEDFADYAEKALVLVREIEDLSLEAEILNNIGVSEQLAGGLEAAADAYRESYELKERVGDRSGAAMVQMNLSEVELDRGVTTGVGEMLEECIAEFASTGFTIGATYSQGLLGQYALRTGDAPRAAELLEGAALAFQELGAEAYAADMEMMLIEADLDLAKLADARTLLDRNRARLAAGGVFENPEATSVRIETLLQRLNELAAG